MFFPTISMKIGNNKLIITKKVNHTQRVELLLSKPMRSGESIKGGTP
jgi:hypothetical protein